MTTIRREKNQRAGAARIAKSCILASLAIVPLVGCTLFADTDVEALPDRSVREVRQISLECGLDSDDFVQGADCFLDEDCGCGTCTPDFGCAEAGFVYIPSGQFTMGSNEAVLTEGAATGPAHLVEISRDFVMSQTEITTFLWEELFGVPGRLAPEIADFCQSECEGGNEFCCPLTAVNIYEAMMLANALSAGSGLEECYVFDANECDGEIGTSCRFCFNEPLTDYSDPACASQGAILDCGDGQIAPDGFNISDGQGGFVNNDFPLPIFDCRETPVEFKGVDCAGYRLPTDAEWEYVASETGNASDLAFYQEGRLSLDFVAQYSLNAPRLAPLGNEGVFLPVFGANGQITHARAARRPASLLPTSLAVYDLLGNVSEMVHSDGLQYEPTEVDEGGNPVPLVDPVPVSTDGLLGTGEVVARGCNFLSDEKDCDLHGRELIGRIQRDATVGFRLVRTVENN